MLSGYRFLIRFVIIVYHALCSFHSSCTVSYWRYLVLGGFLIRLANFAHLDNQSDSEKKQTPFESPRRETTKSRVFLVHRRRREFFSATHKNFRVTSLPLEWQKWCTSSTYCVSLLSYSIAVDIRRLQCNMSKQTSSKQHVLALGLCG